MRRTLECITFCFSPNILLGSLSGRTSRRSAATNSGVCSDGVLVRAPSRRDRPHRLDAAAADHVDPVVEIDGGIAMRGEELDALAEMRRARGIGDGEPAVLVAGEAVGDARP